MFEDEAQTRDLPVEDQKPKTAQDLLGMIHQLQQALSLSPEQTATLEAEVGRVASAGAATPNTPSEPQSLDSQEESDRETFGTAGDEVSSSPFAAEEQSMVEDQWTSPDAASISTSPTDSGNVGCEGSQDAGSQMAGTEHDAAAVHYAANDGEGLKVELNWAASPGASGYNVKRTTTSGGPYTLVASEIPEPSFTDTTVQHGLTYFYVVSAVNEGGESANSAEMSFTPVSPPSPPGTPLAIPGSGQVQLSWSGSSRAATYNVKRSSQQAGPYEPIATGTTSTEYTDRSPANGESYYYVVSAVNGGGESFNSSETSATPLAPPAAVAGLSAVPGSAQVSLSWDASAGASTYTVKRSTVRGGHYGTIAIGVGATSFIDTTVTNGTPYYYVVSAANPGGESSNSPEVAAKPVAAPAPPSGLTAQPGNGHVALNWTASAGATSYNIKRATTTDGLYTTIATPVLDVSYTDQNVTNGLTYYYAITALNAGGESANSAEAIAAPSAPPGPVEGLEATAGNSVATITWSRTEGAASYNVQRATSNAGPFTLVAADLTETTYTDSTVENGANFYYMVTARNVGGEGASSAQVSALPVAPPSPVTEVLAAPGSGVVTLTWERTEGAASYTVKRAAAPGGNYTVLASGQTETTYTDTDVTNGTSYQYVVSAGNVGGESADSSPVVVQPVSPPGSPSSVASTAGNAQVELTWAPVAGAVSYNVKRSTAAGGPYAPVAGEVSAANHTDTGAINGVTYFYVVSAVNQGGESANSPEITATPVEPPSAPTEVSAVSGNARVTLSWAPSLGALSYLVKRSIVKGGRYTVLAMGVTATGYMDTSVANGTPYYYVISAVNPGGESHDSLEVAARPVAPPGIVVGVVAAPGNGRVSLNWTASPGAAGYSAKRASNPGGPYTTIATPLTATSYVDNTVSNGATYTYVISASNAGGESQNSAEASATPVSPPRAVEDVRASPGNAQVVIGWTHQSDAATYNVKRSASLGGPYVTLTSDIAENTFTDRDVTNGTLYHYVVSAVNAGGESSNSTEAVARPVAPPSGIDGLTALPGNEQVTLQWAGLPGSISYNVKRSRNPRGPYSTIASGITEMTYNDSAVSNATPYYYVVSAINAGGESEDSAEVSAEPVSPPSAVTGLKAAPHNASVTLTWTPLPGVTSYNIKRTTTAGGPYEGVATGVTEHAYADSAVTNGTDYFYVVSAENAGGEGPDSSEVRVAPVAPPAAITALTAVSGNSQVVLNWMESARANTYNVKRSDDPAGPFTSVADELLETTFTDIDVTNGVDYYYVVSGVNAGGEGANSIEVIARPVAAPTPITGLSAVPGNTQVILHWEPSSDAASYNVKRSATRGGRYINLALGVTGTTYTDMAVNNGTNYYYVVSAVNAGGESANSAEAHGRPAPPPAAPTGLIAAPGALELAQHGAQTTSETEAAAAPVIEPPAPAAPTIVQTPTTQPEQSVLAEAPSVSLETPTAADDTVPEAIPEPQPAPAEDEPLVAPAPQEELVEEAAPVVTEPLQPVEVPAAVAVTEAAEAARAEAETLTPPAEEPMTAPMTPVRPDAGADRLETLPPPVPAVMGLGSGLMQPPAPPAPAIMDARGPATSTQPLVTPELVQEAAPVVREAPAPVEIPTAVADVEQSHAAATEPEPAAAPAVEQQPVVATEAPAPATISEPIEPPAQAVSEERAAPVVQEPTPVVEPVVTEPVVPVTVEPAPAVAVEPIITEPERTPTPPETDAATTTTAPTTVLTPPATVRAADLPTSTRTRVTEEADSPTPAPQVTSAPQVSPAIREALNRNAQLLLPLVVGKYADRDIVNDSGERIIARGQQISEQLAQTAGQQGKLYDLWVAAQPTQPEGAA